MTAVDGGVAATWRMDERTVTVRGVVRTIRFVRFATGWLVSVDTEDGPTLGANRSPYLAAHGALEPIGVDLVEALTAIGPVPPHSAAVEEARSAFRGTNATQQ